MIVIVLRLLLTKFLTNKYGLVLDTTIRKTKPNGITTDISL